MESERSLIMNQVTNGIAIRMAIMAMAMGQINKNENKEKKE